MKKLFLLAIVVFCLSFSGCQYILDLVIASGEISDVNADSTIKMDWVNEGSATTLTVILYNNDKIYYYLGNHPENGTVSSYNGKNNITDIIAYGSQTYGSNFQLVVKQDKTASEVSLDYMLEALKMMNITKYLLSDPTKDDLHYLEQKG